MMIKDHPLFGVGAGMFERFFRDYKPFYYDAYGHPHNDFLAVYLRAGLVGFLGYILMYVFYFIKMIKFARRLFFKDKFYFSIFLGLIVSVFTFIIAGWGQSFFTNAVNSMLLWFVIGISMIYYYKYDLEITEPQN